MKNFTEKLSMIIPVLCIILITSSCKKEEEEITVEDIDGNVYKTVLIGDQLWMAENLKTTKYNTGDRIPNVKDNMDWIDLTTGARCYYNNDSTVFVGTYGALYNWFAVTDSRKLCPAGWHVPTDSEWKELEMFLGMSQADADAHEWRGTDEGGKLKETGTINWASPNTGANNSTGFTGRPGGYRNWFGPFEEEGNWGIWWTATEFDATYAWKRNMSSEYSKIYNFYNPKIARFSVRCLKD